jgi:SAM-dependent methyltransferase
MAIDIEAARLLLAAAREGVCFRHCLTLGRQSYQLGNSESRRLLREAEYDPDAFPELYKGEYGARYAEPFFKVLGANRVDSLDASPIENATIIHDLNLPAPDELRNRFDVVYDGGTLEHVFNFPAAIKNVMEAVKLGGRLILHTTANNYFGHGFYQFSPELFYRVLSGQNGFRVERMIAIEYGPRRRWFQVLDPGSIRERALLINPFPVLLYVQAVKCESKPLFLQWPHQSDYVLWWTIGANDRRSSEMHRRDAIGRLKRTMIEKAPRLARVLEAFLFSQLNRGLSFRNSRAFVRLNKRDLFRQ